MIPNVTGTNDVSGLIFNPSSQTTSSDATASNNTVLSTPTPSVSASTNTEDDAVAISGQAIMLSRLFMTANSSTAPYLTELTKTTMAADPVDFLTQDDRDFLSKIYSYAQSQGADLRYVDDLASDMGMYRKFGKAEINLNNGGMYDLEGHQLTYSFTTADTKTANAISGGTAIGSTQFDKGFLKYELDPGFTPNHSASFSFLQSMVEHFSSSGSSDGSSLASKFSTYMPSGQNNFVVTTASEVTLVIPKSSSDNTESKAQLKSKRTGNTGSHAAVDLKATKLKLATTLLDAFLAWRRKNNS
ncbi:hypothetical protein [Burkholderia sp. Ax-1719]|uniref:hypothetical protein n=1 Tax=Burkholderia sp. Ax-1719 TaxID=2608334 RepID=UPI001422F8AA|nr:hypothetical protein [Burkholderia sp. Ax-1719]NIE63194.1 hypothetical protein [Burkholderia sp. Ax-1719]